MKRLLLGASACALLLAALFTGISHAQDDPNDRCGAASQHTGSVKPNDAASSQGIVPPTAQWCETLKEDLKAIAAYVIKGGNEERILSRMYPVETVDAEYGPGTHARIVGLIKGAFAAYAASTAENDLLRTWQNAEYAKCHRPSQ
jgi:hypothetical protein